MVKSVTNPQNQGGHATSDLTSEHVQRAGKFEERFKRILTACGVQKDAELARVLDIKPQSITAARKRQQIPTGWVEYVAENHHILADWLFFGIGPMRRGSTDFAPEPGQNEAEKAPPQAVEEGKAPDDVEILRQENKELRQDVRELRKENSALHQENRALLKENGDLRVELAELKARAAPATSTPSESARKIA